MESSDRRCRVLNGEGGASTDCGRRARYRPIDLPRTVKFWIAWVQARKLNFSLRIVSENERGLCLFNRYDLDRLVFSFAVLAGLSQSFSLKATRTGKSSGCLPCDNIGVCLVRDDSGIDGTPCKQQDD